jgi:hypothetical protein
MMSHWQFRPFRINALQTTVAAIGNNVATTSATTITAGNGVVVTPASMQNITVGRWLNFNGGTGSPEDVQVLSVTATTFTANFVNNHSGAYVISSSRTVDLGHLTVNQAGTSIVITLYDGHPNAWVAGTSIAVISPNVSEPTRSFDIRCNRGLFYTVTGTTAGDYTVTYHDRSA